MRALHTIPARRGGVDPSDPTVAWVLVDDFVRSTTTATTVGCKIDAGSEVTVTSTIPDAGDTMIQGAQIVPTTTTARNYDWDFFSLKLLAQTR